MHYHPHILLAYRDGKLRDRYEKDFDQHVRGMLEGLIKIKELGNEFK